MLVVAAAAAAAEMLAAATAAALPLSPKLGQAAQLPDKALATTRCRALY
jgi:hypothetical protein